MSSSVLYGPVFASDFVFVLFVIASLAIGVRCFSVSVSLGVFQTARFNDFFFHFFEKYTNYDYYILHFFFLLTYLLYWKIH